MPKLDFFIAAQKHGLRPQAQKPLAPLTNWKIGGPARWYVELAKSSQARTALNFARQYNLPVFVLGGGTNILVSDTGFEGLVIKITASAIKRVGNVVCADAGAAMGRLAAFCQQHQLTGLEWAFGIPGTVGGAVFGNSNCFGGSTGQTFLSGVTVDENGRLWKRAKAYFRFSYDYSKLQDTREVLLRAVFKLAPAPLGAIEAKRQEIVSAAKERVLSQPLGQNTAGSTFKAIKPTAAVISRLAKITPDWRVGMRDGLISAGFIIDACLGLKGYVVGGMRISEKHANFFVNLGNATAADAKQLIDFVKKQCQDKLHLKLEEEIRYVGEFKT